ncbi:MAG: hypothetical protein HC930_08750 [Hydrococcus sp. SU_1_0]|nr:hypothetical protein [Hydrococcus sp. SU_1_0]
MQVGGWLLEQETGQIQQSFVISFFVDSGVNGLPRLDQVDDVHFSQ